MRRTADLAAYFFIVAVVFLSAISIFAVWDLVDNDVIEKSIETISLLAVVAAIVMVAERFMDTRSPEEISGMVGGEDIAPITLFPMIRHNTIVLLIVSAVLFAFFGILSIWDVLSGQVVEKSLGSIAIVAFGAFIVVVTCLAREGRGVFKRSDKPMSTGTIILIFLAVIVFLPFLLGVLGGL